MLILKISKLLFKEMYCSSQIDTGNTIDGFLSNGVSCGSDGAIKQWTNVFDPFYNTSNGVCYGYLFVNRSVPCYIENLADRNVRRLCRCVKHGKIYFTIFKMQFLVSLEFFV